MYPSLHLWEGFSMSDPDTHSRQLGALSHTPLLSRPRSPHTLAPSGRVQTAGTCAEGQGVRRIETHVDAEGEHV